MRSLAIGSSRLNQATQGAKVPPGAGALELVAGLRAARRESSCFPGVERLDHTWAKVVAAAGLEAGARIYDLRHSFASIGARAGMIGSPRRLVASRTPRSCRSGRRST